MLPLALHVLHLLGLGSRARHLVYGAQLAEHVAGGRNALKGSGELVNTVVAIRKTRGCMAGQVHLRSAAIGALVQRTRPLAFEVVPIAEPNRVCADAFHRLRLPVERAPSGHAIVNGLRPYRTCAGERAPANVRMRRPSLNTLTTSVGDRRA